MSAPTCDRAASPRRVVLVTGLSGAGRSLILRTLEDAGFEAVDNLPLSLVEPLSQQGRRPLAIGVDTRTQGFTAAALLATLSRLRVSDRLQPELVYAEADPAALLRRFTETRRRHPLAPSGGLADGIAAERQLMSGLREAADLAIDTTELEPAALRGAIEQRFAALGRSQTLSLVLMSFAFPAGLPRDADLVFDSRFLRNPHYHALLRPLTGLDARVADYVRTDADYSSFVGMIETMLGLLLPRFVGEGKRYATLAVGCTGGRHRSVTIVEDLAAFLEGRRPPHGTLAGMAACQPQAERTGPDRGSAGLTQAPRALAAGFVMPDGRSSGAGQGPGMQDKGMHGLGTHTATAKGRLAAEPPDSGMTGQVTAGAPRFCVSGVRVAGLRVTVSHRELAASRSGQVGTGQIGTQTPPAAPGSQAREA